MASTGSRSRPVDGLRRPGAPTGGEGLCAGPSGRWRRLRLPLLLGLAGFALCLSLSLPAIASGSERTASLKDPSGRTADPAARLEPRVLSAADVDRYTRISALQEQGRWPEADRLIARLENPVLMGHVLFQRYMHPTAWRSSYAELKGWLDLYADHPDADRIHALALKRRPSGAPAPRAPERTVVRGAAREPSAFDVYNPPRSSAQRTAANRIRAEVWSLLRRERPTQALGYLTRADIRNQLTEVEFDTLRQAIAQSYLAEQVEDEALTLAEAVIARSGKAVPLAYWTAGLAAWRKGDLPRAERHFEALAEAGHVEADTRAAGAYWAARARLRIGEPEGVLPLLRLAAARPDSFYGLLAAYQLGQMPDLTELPPAPGPTEIAAALTLPGVARAVALSQLGRYDIAELELRRAHGPTAREHDAALAAIAAALDLPAAQLQVARALPGSEGLAHLYPLPDYAPAGGFRLDKALVYAFVHKESEFVADAESHAGALGLMQVMPRTALHITGDRSVLDRSGKARLLEPDYNLALGQSYLRELMGRVEPDGNLFKMAVAYNSGPSNLNRWTGTLGPHAEDPLLFIESIPAPETRNFVERVMTNLWLYRARLGQKPVTLSSVAAGDWPVYTPLDGLSVPLAAAPRSTGSDDRR
ncbi:MAG: lytic transglycosylase domain-containing protein [Alphaproteobacteria bacterium]|nr:lytic transglycosylase domain-containing protein [Alphaproteobacteria bacterium]